jgi:uncharacterized membrane protein (DUF4010 family)
VLTRRAGSKHDPDTITVLAALLCYGYGALLWFGYRHLPVVLAFATTSLMYFKTELHGISRRLSREDLLSFLQFVLISVIVLPLLPDQNYGPYDALNPHRLWLMVVLISGMSLTGYVLLRFVGPDRGALWLGVLGGAVSSTMTTLIYARQTRQTRSSLAFALFVVLSANLVVALRLAVLVAVMERDLLPQVLPVLAGGVLGGGLMVWSAWRALAQQHDGVLLDMKNPAELRTALSFAGIFGLVLLATAWLHDLAGDSGVYLVALISGLTDMDAITLSLLRMHEQELVQAGVVTRSVVLAYASNMAFKAGIVAFSGGRALLWPVLRGYAAVLAGLGLALLLV